MASNHQNTPQAFTDWQSDLTSCLQLLGSDFSLEDVYGFEDELSSIYPANQTIRSTIRRVLQELRDRGAITFLDNYGHYSKTETFPASLGILNIAEDVSHDPFEDDAEPPNDPVERYLAPIRRRRGARLFRKRLLHLYQNRCAITGDGPVEVLEAAHIEPHSLSGRNSSDNGLLLRADVHTLFDIRLIKINPNSLQVETHSKLKSTPYGDLQGKKLRQRRDGLTPNYDYLQNHYERAVLVGY
jgi:hypothetical protein